MKNTLFGLLSAALLLAFAPAAKAETGVKIVDKSGNETFIPASEIEYMEFTADPDDKEWKSLGYLDYTDGFICSLWVSGLTTYQVEIEENIATPGLYRLVNPYGAGYPWNEPGDWEVGENAYLVINASNPERVYVDYSPTFTAWENYGYFVMWSYAAYLLDNNWPADEIAGEGLFGTLADGKITFPAGTLLLAMTKYSGGSFFNVNTLIDDDLEDIYNPDGTLFAPFCVDFNTLTPTPNAPASNSRSGFSKNMFSAPKAAEGFRK